MPSLASLIMYCVGTSVEVIWNWGDGLNDTLVHNTLETWRPGSGIPEIKNHTYAIPAEALEVKVTVRNNYQEYNFTVAILDIYKAIVEDELQLICPFAPYVDGEGRGEVKFVLLPNKYPPTKAKLDRNMDYNAEPNNWEPRVGLFEFYFEINVVS